MKSGMTDFYFNAVKEDFLSSLTEVILGKEWIDYDRKQDVFIGMGKQQGLYISDTEGKVLVTDLRYANYQYSPEFRLFYRFSAEGGYAVSVRSLEEVLA
jgi:hypothetical protein